MYKFYKPLIFFQKTKKKFKLWLFSRKNKFLHKLRYEPRGQNRLALKSAIFHVSLNLPSSYVKFTPGKNLPQVENF